MAQLLFVQNAHGFEVAADGRTLTLKGLSPTTLFFSDRPVRIAGHYRTDEHLRFWKDGPDSFLKDPPNATLSVFDAGTSELADVSDSLHDRDAIVTACGRIGMFRKRINLTHVLAGQRVGLKDVGEGIWSVSSIQYDLGYIDLEQKTLQPLDNPFGLKGSPMS
jgi:hypothetical protein